MHRPPRVGLDLATTGETSFDTAYRGGDASQAPVLRPVQGQTLGIAADADLAAAVQTVRSASPLLVHDDRGRLVGMLPMDDLLPALARARSGHSRPAPDRESRQASCCRGCSGACRRRLPDRRRPGGMHKARKACTKPPVLAAALVARKSSRTPFGHRSDLCCAHSISGCAPGHRIHEAHHGLHPLANGLRLPTQLNIEARR